MTHQPVSDNDLMDLVNAQDEVIGSIYQSEATSLVETRQGFVRGVSAFVQNDQGKLWIPRRTAHKRVAPNGLDYSVSEHVQKGETYEQAVVRGFREELFMGVDPKDLTLLGRLDPLDILPYFFITVYLYKANGVKEFNTADFVSYEWLTPAELLARLESGEPAKNAMKSVLKEFF